MKITELKNTNYIHNKKENLKQKIFFGGFDNFSSVYCSAIKSKNLAFTGKMSEAELKQRCAELKKQLLEDGVIESEDEISWYIDNFANEANITIAKKVFSRKNLKPCAHDILATTNEENLAVASYICDRPFPLNSAFDILVATNKDNAKTSLAMCMSEDIPKDAISQALVYIKDFNDKTAAKIVLEKNYPENKKIRSVTSLTPYNSTFVEELLNDKDYPRKNIPWLISKMVNEREVQARQELYQFLSSNPKNPKEDIEEAVCKCNSYNRGFMRQFYEYFFDDGKLNLEQINRAWSGCRFNYDAYQKIKIYDDIVAQENLSPDELSQILKSTKSTKLIKEGLEFIKAHQDFPQELKVFYLSNIDSVQKACQKIGDDKYYQGIKEFAEVYKKLMANPELYINGEADTKEEAQEELMFFVDENFLTILQMASVLGEETLEFMFRKRIDGVEDYIVQFLDFNEDGDVEYLNPENKYLKLLCQLVNSKNIDGSEFSPKEKLTFLDIISAYQDCNAQITIKIRDGKVDIKKLQEDLLRHVFRFCGMDDKKINAIPKEILAKWDISKAHFLANLERKFFEDNDYTLDHIINAVNSGIDFKDYIQGDNYFGKTNREIAQTFKEFDLNYNAWFNPSKDAEVRFQHIDSNQERLAQVVSQIEEDIEALRKTPAKSFIDKHFGDCILGDKFKINEKYCKNKETLENFIKNMFELLDRNIFSRAQGNLDNPIKKENARLTLTIKNHLEQRLKDVKECETKKKQKPIDLTIKMWDRNPIHDLFQGNYSTCCIGLGEANDTAMPTYLLNTTFNMIEFVDNITGETIGNALCYFAVNELGEPQFIIDNIEIANKHKMSDSTSDKFLDSVVKYCINLLRAISKQNIPILMGTSYNDVHDEKMSVVEFDYLKILGDTNGELVYIDAFGGWEDGEFDAEQNSEYENLEMFYLANSLDEDFIDNDNLER